MEMIPMMKTNLSSSVKAYLYKYIKEFDTRKGTKLPPESTIAENLSVSRVTIRRALDDLEQEGIVFRIHGKGTFINPEALQIKVNLNPVREFRRMIRDSGYNSHVEVVRFEVQKVDQKLASILQIEQGSQIYVMEKVYFADGHPAIISIDRFPKSLFHEEIEAHEGVGHSSFDILHKKAGKVVKQDKIEIETMTIKEMKQYSTYSEKMECKSVLAFHGINYDQDNIPVIYDTEFYDTKYIRFNMLRIINIFEE